MSRKMPFFTLLHASKTSAQHVIHLLPTLAQEEMQGYIRWYSWITLALLWRNEFDGLGCSFQKLHPSFLFIPSHPNSEKKMTKEFGKRAQLLQTKIWILDNGQIVNAVLQFSMTLVHSLEIDLWILNCQGTISEDLLAKPDPIFHKLPAALKSSGHMLLSWKDP